MAPPIPPQLLLVGASAIAAYFAFRPGTRLKGRPPGGAAEASPPPRQAILKKRQTVDIKLPRFAPEPQAILRKSQDLRRWTPQPSAPFASRGAALPWAALIYDLLEPTDAGVAAREMLKKEERRAERYGDWAGLSGAIRTAAAIGAVEGIDSQEGDKGVASIVYVLCSHDWNWDLSDSEHRKLVGEVFKRLWMGPGDAFPANTLTSCTRKHEPEDRPYWEIIGYEAQGDGAKKELCRDKLNDINNAWNVLWSRGGPAVAPWPYMERYMRMMVYGRSGHYWGGPDGKPSAPGWAKGFAVAVTSAAAGPGVGAAVAMALEE